MSTGFAGTDRYELLRTLGQGGMGTVYAVFDRRRQRKVALKILSDPDAGSLFRFKREFRAVADLRHPNLVRLYDLGVLPSGGFFFTMELIEGRDLAAHVQRTPQEVGATLKALAETVEEGSGATQTWTPPPAGGVGGNGGADSDEIAQVLCGVVAGLSHLHQARKVHRDLKPSNVIVDEGGRARLLDFGILRDLDREGLTVQGAVGTPLYMAPEQIAGDAVTPAADLYSLGCILYQLLTGQPPFTGRPTTVLMKHMREQPAAPSEVRPCDARLEGLCLELLRKDPTERPALPDVLDRLVDVGGQAPAATTSVLTPLRVPQLLGRDAELARLNEAYERAQEGPCVVLVAGESGAGKSALAAEFALRMQERVPAWFGGCYEREHVPYKAFDAIVDAAAVELARRGDDAFRLLPPGTPALARMFPVLREIPAVQRIDHETPMRDARAERARAGRAFLALLSNLSGGAPPILIVDDMQRADQESLDVIRWLGRATAAPRCLVVGTYRSEEVGPAHPLLEVFEGTDCVERLDVPPLGRAYIDQLADAVATSPLSETQLNKLAEDAQGNPFLVVELARAAGQLEGDAMPTVAELVAGRLAKLGPEAREVLEVAAIAGGRASFEMLQAAAGAEPAILADAIDELLRVQLLREVQGHHGEDAYDLIHDRLRQAVYESIAEERRVLLHRVLAMHLAADDDASRAVEHWRLGGEPAKAREAGLTAAANAEEKLAFDRAAELYALAAQDDASWPLQVSLAKALAKAGRHRESAEAFERAARQAPARQARELSLDAATERLTAGDVAGGMAGLDTLLRTLGSRIQRGVLWSFIAISWRTAYMAIAWWISDVICRYLPRIRFWRRQQPDPEAAFKMKVFDVAHQHLAAVRPVEAARFGVRHALLARRYDDPRRQGRARIGYALFLVGDLGVVAAGRTYHHLTIGEALCAEADDHQALLQAQVTRGFLNLLSSNWEGIRQCSREAEALARKAGLYGDPTLMLLESMHIGSEMFRGDLPSVIRTAEGYLSGARARGNVHSLAWPLSMLGYVLLWQGEYEQGKAYLEEALEVTPAEPLTVVRVHVELVALSIELFERKATEGLAKLADLNRRWIRSGLIASALENGTYRLMVARFRLLASRQGTFTWRCPFWAGIQSLLPAPTSLKDEMLRLKAARAYMWGKFRRSCDYLDRGIYKAEARNNRFSLGMLYVARARVREKLGEPGAELDRERGERMLDAIGAKDCFMLETEGWLDQREDLCVFRAVHNKISDRKERLDGDAE